MKKMVIVLMVTMVSSNSCAFDDLQATTRTIVNEEPTTFLDASSLVNEDSYQEDEVQGIDEYDQNVTDNVIPPKISQAEVMFKEMLGAVLVRYISLREVAREYFTEAKNVVMQWYQKIVNAK